MQVILVRHGKTAGNQKRLYVGRTDEPLCEEGIAQLRQNRQQGLYNFPVDRLICSPMQRCLQTAALICPGQQPICDERLRETDFGIFEGKSYEQLKTLPAYQEWLASGGEAVIEQGESRAQMTDRCLKGVAHQLKLAEQDGCRCVLFVVHGGSIMAILERYALPQRPFYDFQVENGQGWQLDLSLQGENGQSPGRCPERCPAVRLQPTGGTEE